MRVQPEELKILFTKRLRDRRAELGMTQKSLAILIDAHQPYIVDLEKGRKHPTLDTLAKLSEALTVPPDYFLNPG